MSQLTDIEIIQALWHDLWCSAHYAEAGELIPAEMDAREGADFNMSQDEIDELNRRTRMDIADGVPAKEWLRHCLRSTAFEQLFAQANILIPSREARASCLRVTDDELIKLIHETA